MRQAPSKAFCACQTCRRNSESASRLAQQKHGNGAGYYSGAKDYKMGTDEQQTKADGTVGDGLTQTSIDDAKARRTTGHRSGADSARRSDWTDGWGGRMFECFCL